METLEIGFPNASASDAGRMAEDLAGYVRQQAPEAKAELRQSDPNAMDLGATVALVLGTPALVALARGLADWIKRQGDPDIVIKTKKGEIVVRGPLDAAAKRQVILSAIENCAV